MPRGTGSHGVLGEVDGTVQVDAGVRERAVADAQSIPIPTEPSNSKSQKKHKPKRKHTKEPKVPPTESQAEHNLPSLSHDPVLSGEDSPKLKELMNFYTNLSNKVLDLESEVIDIKSTYQERKIADIDADVEINLEKAQAVAYNLDLDHQEKDDVTAASVEVSKPRKRKVVIIQYPEETTTTTVTVQPKVQAKDKGKAILIKEPKSLKRQAQIKLDEEVARQLEAELNANVEWNAMIEQVQKREKLTYANMASYKMNYVKGMTYDEIRTLFEKHYNYNQAFLNEVNERVKVLEKEVSQEKEVEVESSKRECESLEQEIVKKEKMKQETEELKKNLQIVPDDDDDVYTDATPLALKIPIIDYKIHTERNRPYFKIIRADGNHMFFLSFSTMLKNVYREDLESLWNIIRERFAKTEPKNYSDDFLLNTLQIMFEKHNVEANVWKDQKGKYGLAKIFLLVERMYPLTHFTLEQMMNNVRLKVEDESEMSLELLRLVKR
nr:hypothetical protein [Tanacetum cinerariifolium]